MICISYKSSVIILVIYVFSATIADLGLSGTRCGSKVCKVHEYCSDYDRLCKPCLDICEEKTHNYDANLCIRDCQDYLHDIRYVRKDGGGTSSNNDDLRVVVQNLHQMVTITLTLTCLVLLALALVIVMLIYGWAKKNNVTCANIRKKLFSKKSNTNRSTKAPSNGTTVTVQSSGKHDLRLDMPPPGALSEHSPATISTTISRRPAEDSALDYAYDNPAMSNTPSPHSKPTESGYM